MGRVTRRDAVAIILIALVCGIVSALPPLDFMHRRSIDALTALRWQGQRIAVGQQKNSRPLNVYLDSDDVVRRIPLTFPGGEKGVASMALELASRALNAEPVQAEDGSVTLAGYHIPGLVPNTLTL